MSEQGQAPPPAQADFRDLGFGNKLGIQTHRLINPDGSFNIERRQKGIGAIHPYLFLISIPTWQFIIVVISSYILFNSIFAFLYMLAGIEQLAGAPEQSLIAQFAHAFFFSVQTFTTVGYGTISPLGNSANIIASLEAMAGLMGFALASGVFYGRFSKPSAKIRFSEKALISPYKDINSFQFRVVNRRNNQLIELEAQLVFMYYREEAGQIKPRFFRLPLERDKVTLFPLNWTLVHPITPESPIYGKSPQFFKDHNAEFLIIIKAYDDTFAQLVHTRYSYKATSIHWGEKFEMMYHANEEGITVLEMEDIDETYRAPLNEY